MGEVINEGNTAVDFCAGEVRRALPATGAFASDLLGTLRNVRFTVEIKAMSSASSTSETQAPVNVERLPGYVDNMPQTAVAGPRNRSICRRSAQLQPIFLVPDNRTFQWSQS
jgi:hypothetical protein